jgi:hypothetical protein
MVVQAEDRRTRGRGVKADHLEDGRAPAKLWHHVNLGLVPGTIFPFNYTSRSASMAALPSGF